jgi:hypothetical protein
MPTAAFADIAAQKVDAVRNAYGTRQATDTPGHKSSTRHNRMSASDRPLFYRRVQERKTSVLKLKQEVHRTNFDVRNTNIEELRNEQNRTYRRDWISADETRGHVFLADRIRTRLWAKVVMKSNWVCLGPERLCYDAVPVVPRSPQKSGMPLLNFSPMARQ